MKSLTLLVVVMLLTGCPTKKHVKPVGEPIEIKDTCIVNRIAFTSDCERTADGLHFICQNVLIESQCLDAKEAR